MTASRAILYCMVNGVCNNINGLGRQTKTVLSAPLQAGFLAHQRSLQLRHRHRPRTLPRNPPAGNQIKSHRLPQQTPLVHAAKLLPGPSRPVKARYSADEYVLPAHHGQPRHKPSVPGETAVTFPSHEHDAPCRHAQTAIPTTVGAMRGGLTVSFEIRYVDDAAGDRVAAAQTNTICALLN